MPGSETTDKVLGSAGLARLIGRIKAYVIPDGTTIERKQDGTLGLKSGGIQSEFLSNGCVTTDKIASSAVTSDKLADGSVETSAIASLQDLRSSMGLGNTLGVLQPENGGTGCSSIGEFFGVLLGYISAISFSFDGSIAPWQTPTASQWLSSPSSDFSSAVYNGFSVRQGNVGAIVVENAGTYVINLTAQPNASGHPAKIVVVGDADDLQDHYESSLDVIYQKDFQSGSINQAVAIPAGGGIAFYHTYGRNYNITLNISFSL